MTLAYIRAALRVLRGGTQGIAEYLSGQARFRGPNGPLNGQQARQALTSRIMARAGVRRVIETGSFRGDSTAWFRAHGARVWSIEISPRMYGYCRARFFGTREITLLRGNSAAILRGLLARLPADGGALLCYLDAHWRDHLPLAEEVQAILASGHGAIGMIDDFHVPDCPSSDYLGQSEAAVKGGFGASGLSV